MILIIVVNFKILQILAVDFDLDKRSRGLEIEVLSRIQLNYLDINPDKQLFPLRQRENPTGCVVGILKQRCNLCKSKSF